MQIIHQMTIDLALQLPVLPVAAVQGDGNTRVLAVTLLENGAPWQIPEAAVADVAFRKPDGTKGIYSKLPDGSNATSRNGNVLSATLAPQMLTCPGKVLATVVFRMDGTKTLAAFPFTIMVEASPAAGAQVSEDYFNPTQLSDLRAELAAGLATKAPAGYGLGEFGGKNIAGVDLNTVFENGWHSYNGQGPLMNGPDGYEALGNFAILEVSTAPHNNRPMTSVQTLTFGAGGLEGYQCRRAYNGADWLPWCWINPHMAPATEYRTTERWNGKAVYTKLVDCGAAVHTGFVPHESTYTHVIRYAGVIADLPMPLKNGDSYAEVSVVGGGFSLLESGYDGLNWKVQIWYVKD